MIATMTLRAGRAPGQTAQPIPVAPLNVFVGPNNSGKSKILGELLQFFGSGVPLTQQALPLSVLDNLTFSKIVDDQKKETLAQNLKQAPVQSINEKLLSKKEIAGLIAIAFRDPVSFCRRILRANVLMLDARQRTDLVLLEALGDLSQPPKGKLGVLFQDSTKLSELRRISYDAFGKYLVLDPTNSGNVRIRLSNRLPTSELEEKGIHREAIEFHQNAQVIEEFSDGVKAYTGIMLELIAGNPLAVLIDEPEAFLHPPLAARLAVEMARAARAGDKFIFAATHSPHFLMGCIQSRVPLNIIRLTYQERIATARTLTSSEILPLMNDPLLRSAGVLNGLFYDSVIVTESDADRAFYEEINQRLLKHNPSVGIPNCLFLNAQNKQTLHRIVEPLRKLGIPVIAIADIDALENGGNEWSRFLKSADMPGALIDSLATLRARIVGDGKTRNWKRHGGINVLDPKDKDAAQKLLDDLREYGILIVPGGELESWLKELRVPTGDKATWLTRMFEKMGNDENSSDYVRPAGDDVWKFLGTARDWLLNPSRKGIPA